MVRSHNDTIFGKEAAHLHSKDRFRWTDRHLDIFVRHVFNAPDICLQPALLNKLIAELKLNGYEDITTKAGHSVHEIIKPKVTNKAEAVRNGLNKGTHQMVIIKKCLGLDRAKSMDQTSLTTTDNGGQLRQGQTVTVSQATPPRHTSSSVATASLQNPLPSTQKAGTDVKGRGPGRDPSSRNNLQQERQPEFENPWWPFEGNAWDRACRSPRANPSPAVAPGPDSREHTRRHEGRRRSAPGQRNEQVLCMELPDDRTTVRMLVKPPKPTLFDLLGAQDDDKVKEKVKKEGDDGFPTFYVTVDHDKLYNWTNDGLTRDRRRLMMAVLGKERGLSLAQELHMIQERIMAMGG
ncbi:hypothetical protein B0T11DRAFT_270335 [Plectosphaerella cucumerina]|uniref:Uncharacterized protein n=1 Tax=Plectosphaerella cucumerina TaxID=40658 RepID=A0A8K0TT60_9PEZI|nr:hypothetical protein B0T11DRAFT_270335 [Plectosphaerella cucumerina]